MAAPRLHNADAFVVVALNGALQIAVVALIDALYLAVLLVEHQRVLYEVYHVVRRNRVIQHLLVEHHIKLILVQVLPDILRFFQLFREHFNLFQVLGDLATEWQYRLQTDMIFLPKHPKIYNVLSCFLI